MNLLKSFTHAIEGIHKCIVSEKNFRIELGVAAFTILLSILFTISTMEWMIVLICVAMVLGFEMVNTCIEKLSDEITQNIHPLIKNIKDISAGAVFTTAVVSFIIGSIIFIPKFYQLWSSHFQG